jgi:hypothetical protein
MKFSAPLRWLPTLAFFACLIAAMAGEPAWGAGAGATNATVTYRKIFKSSYPEYVEIKISDSGMGTFDIRQLSEESNPHTMRLDTALVQMIFDLVAKLNNFDGVDLEIHRRIANLGQKTFVYDRGAESHQVTFNYTLNHDAVQLLTIFEGLSRQQTDLSDLDRTMRYDPLGVNDVLLQLQKDLDNKLVPDPAQFLPSLDRLAADTHFIDIARTRARKLAARIRSSS